MALPLLILGLPEHAGNGMVTPNIILLYRFPMGLVVEDNLKPILSFFMHLLIQKVFKTCRQH